METQRPPKTPNGGLVKPSPVPSSLAPQLSAQALGYQRTETKGHHRVTSPGQSVGLTRECPDLQAGLLILGFRGRYMTWG